MNTLIMILIACSAGGGNEPTIDTRQDWELFSPSGGPDQGFGRTIRWYADPRISSRAEASARDWELHLSCGFDLVQVGDPQVADVTLSCGDFEGADPAFIMVGEPGSITLSDRACSDPGASMLQHAFSLGLGFEQQFTWFDNATMGNRAWLEMIDPAAEVQGWSMIETDGWRAWALERGAPGCGDAEIEWSWIADPSFYRSPPAPDVALALIKLSDHR